MVKRKTHSVRNAFPNPRKKNPLERKLQEPDMIRVYKSLKKKGIRPKPTPMPDKGSMGKFDMVKDFSLEKLLRERDVSQGKGFY